MAVCRVLHVITGLGVGGAERSLLRISNRLQERGIESRVIVLGGRGPISAEVEARGIRVEHLQIAGARGLVAGARRLRALVREMAPHVVQGWMYHGNIAALYATIGTDVRLAWNIRQALHRDDLFKLTTRLVVYMNLRLSPRASAIVFNSETAMSQHIDRGLRAGNAITIPNGIDVEEFRPCDEGGRSIRRELGFSDADVVVCAVGRSHAIKGHEVLMAAAQRVVRADGSARFLIVGRDVRWDREPFSLYGDDMRLRSSVLLLEQRKDIPDLLRASDIFVSTSHTEGFPNAVAEAMACGLPCVVTDVGDSSAILGNCGVVVPARDVAAMSEAVSRLIGGDPAGRRRLGMAARDRIVKRYAVEDIVDRYATLYLRLRGRDFSDRRRG